MSYDYAIMIDGGMGRQICAIPALEKFVEKNPNTVIMSHFWTSMFWGNKKLADHVFDAGTKGLFEQTKDSKIMKPEPYHNNDFLNNRCHLIDAFNQELNGDKEKCKLPKIYFSISEKANAANNRLVSGKKNVVIQPFGSTANFMNGQIIDQTVRSLNMNNTKHLIDKLFAAGMNVIMLDHRDMGAVFDKSKYVNTLGMDHRSASSLIDSADYFIGVDSAGQHIAAFNEKPSTVFFGASSIENYGYPDRQKIITREGYENKKYMAMRLAEFDYQIASVENDDLLDFRKDEFDGHCDWIINDIRQKT